MQYRLIFTKILPSHEFAGVGMGGNVMAALSMITNMDDDDLLCVDMETHECACTEKDAFIEDTNNCWEYYFHQKKPDPTKDIQCVTMQQTGKMNFSYVDVNVGMDLDRYVPWKGRFYKNFQLKPSVKDFVNVFYREFMERKITLGVQIRQTDQKHHSHTKGLDEYISRIRVILKEAPQIEQVFLATDDSLIIPMVERALSVPVIYHKDFYRATAENRHLNPYDRFEAPRRTHRYLLSLECLQDIFTLTKCDYLLKAELSSISIVACLLAENIKRVYRV